MIELEYTAAQESFRAEIRAWLQRNVPEKPLLSFDTEEGFRQHRGWEAALASGNWSMVTWPKEYGGRGCDLVEWLIFEEEYWRAGAPARVNQNGIFLLGPTLMEFGTPEQQQRFLPRMASGEEVWAQGWSEPQAGSDMAAIRCRADRQGDQYVLNGQKIWSTRAVWADWLFGLFRTQQGSVRHHGLSFLLVPLGSPGITVRPIRQLNGLTGFAEIFFDDVHVSAENLLGPENKGWSVAMATAGFERGLMLRSPGRFQQTAHALLRLQSQQAGRGQVDPAAVDSAVQAWMDAEAYTVATYQTACRLLKGGHIGSEASTNKIFWSELDLAMHESAFNLFGSLADIEEEAGVWLDGLMFAQAGPIYAGTNEIQRNIIAERMLGLPRG